MRESGYYWILPIRDGIPEIGEYKREEQIWLFAGKKIPFSTIEIEKVGKIGQRIPDNETLKKLNHEG